MDSFTVFGRPDCSYCVRAQQLLEARGLAFEYVDMPAVGISKADLSKTLGRPVQTVPQILHGKHYVGGCTDLEAYLKTMDTQA